MKLEDIGVVYIVCGTSFECDSDVCDFFEGLHAYDIVVVGSLVEYKLFRQLAEHFTHMNKDNVIMADTYIKLTSETSINFFEKEKFV